jgi:hypothetical protein
MVMAVYSQLDGYQRNLFMLMRLRSAMDDERGVVVFVFGCSARKPVSESRLLNLCFPEL